MNKNLLDRMQSLSIEEQYKECYTDPLTGALNRRAFFLDDRRYIAICDLDSLKWVNDNHGHRAGDEMMIDLVKELQSVFGEDSVFRMGARGDEFSIKSARPIGMHRLLEALRERMPVFSYGFGVTIDHADADLNKDKLHRESTGDRAVRGEMPPWALKGTANFQRATA